MRRSSWAAAARSASRVGLLMLGSHAFFIAGWILLAIGLTLQAGATGAVKAIKMSVKLASGNTNRDHDHEGAG